MDKIKLLSCVGNPEVVYGIFELRAHEMNENLKLLHLIFGTLYLWPVILYVNREKKRRYFPGKLKYDKLQVNSSDVHYCPPPYKLGGFYCQWKQPVLSMKCLQWQTERTPCQAAAVIHKKFSFIGAWECLQDCQCAHCGAPSSPIWWRNKDICKTNITCGSFCSISYLTKIPLNQDDTQR